MRTLCRVLLVGLAVLSLAIPLQAYPIPPVPLWKLVEGSDRIVVAEVVETIEVEAPPFDLHGAPSGTRIDGPGYVARLLVRETWKGDEEPEVRVPYDRNMVCPAPPRYAEGKTVVAFLEKRDTGWSTVGLSYGTLYPRRGEMEDFRVMTRDAVRLQAAGPVSPQDRLAWLVRAASRPGTRWHGLYQLHPQSDRLHSHYDSPRPEDAELPPISQRQLEEIAHGFVASPPVDRTLPMALDVLAPLASKEVDQAAVSAIEALLARPEPPWWIRDALRPLLLRFGDKEPAARLAPLGEEFDDVAREAVRRLWTKARHELPIPNARPAPDPEVEVPGVGSNTPS